MLMMQAVTRSIVARIGGLIPSDYRRVLREWPPVALVLSMIFGDPVEGWCFRMYRITRACWSGSGFEVHGMSGGHCAFELQLLRIDWKRLIVERTLRVEANCLDPADLAHFYWEPVENSLNQLFVVRVRPIREPDTAKLNLNWRLGVMVDQYSSSSEVDRAVPKAMVVSPVTQCNLNCVHCISSFTRKRVNIMEEAHFDQIIHTVRTGGVHHIATDYSGDFLYANERHGPWLSRFSSLDIPFRIDTHANNLSAEISEQLLESRLGEINFSIDSMDPSTYAEIRRGSKPLDVVLSNIENFMRLKKIKRPGMKAVISFSVMKRNIDTLLPALEFAGRVGINMVQFYHVLAFDRKIAEESMQLYPDKYRLFHDRAVDEAARRGVQLVITPPVTLVGQREVHTPCYEPWESLMVLGDGSVLGCCVPGNKIGDLNSESLHEIWHGAALREVRRRIHTNDPPDVCRNCPMKRTVNNFRSFVPGLSRDDQRVFVDRCIAAHNGL